MAVVAGLRGMKVIYAADEAWEEEYFKGQLPGVELLPAGDTAAEVLSVFVDHSVDAAELDKYPNLKLIATRSTGFDHIDLKAAAARGIVVASVPSYGVNTVAEFAFALILALSRKVCEAHARTVDGSFSQEGLRGFDLAGKTLGLIGCGRIGVHTATIARGFGMEVLVYDVIQNAELAAKTGFVYVSLDDLLARADIVSIHVPYNTHTHHLINKDNVGRMKHGAYLVNTARGAVVETQALVEALESGALAGAGLDVLEDENNPQNPLNRRLIKHPGVIVTPHVAFDTTEAVKRIIDTTAQNIAAFMRNEPLNLVKPEP